MLVKAELKNGVLSVSLPVASARKHRHLPIECSDAFDPWHSGSGGDRFYD